MNNKEIYNKIVKILNKEDNNVMETLEIIKKELETEIITNGKINNSLKQAFKRLQKVNDIRPRFQNVLVNTENKYTITNSYYLITYTEEQLPNELKPFIDQTNDNMYKDFEFEKIKNNDTEIEKVSINYNYLTKIYKYEKLNNDKLVKKIYTLNNGLTFDLQYFFDILTLLKEKDLKNIEIEISKNDLLKPINIYSKNGKAILLPIRKKEEEIQEQLELQEKIIKEA